MKLITEINTTDKAKKKIQTIAKSNNLDFDFVYNLFSFHWNYDGHEGDWVNNLEKNKEYQQRRDFICQKLKIEQTEIEKNHIVERLQEKLKVIDNELLFKNFILGSMNKGYCLVSEYASYHYLNNSNIDRLNSLEWKAETYNAETIRKNVFLKVFRGGSVDRYNLEYLYADLLVNLPYLEISNNTKDWTQSFVNEIENAEKMSLSDMKTLLKSYCKGDKYFLQTILESLSYSGIIKVKGHSTEDVFIPDFRNKLSEHFYSNEWTYPLRFWNEDK